MPVIVCADTDRENAHKKNKSKNSASCYKSNPHCALGLVKKR